MTGSAAALLLFLGQVESPAGASAVSIRIQASYSLDSAVVREAIRKVLPEARVIWHVQNQQTDLRIDGNCKAAVRLKDLNQALSAMAKADQEKMQSPLSLNIDLDRLMVDGKFRIVGAGTVSKEDLANILKGIPDCEATDLQTTGATWEAVLTLKSPMSVAKLQGRIGAGNLTLSDVELPALKVDPAKFQCPKGCSTADASGLCPECLSTLKEAAAPASSGGC